MTGVIFGCSRAHGPAAWAMLMDIVPSHSRVKWFPVMSAIAVTAPLLGEAISYPFLAMHLTNYTALWAVRALNVQTTSRVRCALHSLQPLYVVFAVSCRGCAC
jgi:MFS family permease